MESFNTDEFVGPITMSRVLIQNQEKSQIHQCYFCSNYAINPTVCILCKQMYCRKCLTKYLKQKPWCAKCRNASKVDQFKKPNKALWSQHLHGIYIQCKQKDCQEILSYSFLYEHEQYYCEYKTRKCITCQKDVLNKKRFSHKMSNCFDSKPDQKICKNCNQPQDPNYHNCVSDFSKRLYNLECKIGHQEVAINNIKTQIDTDRQNFNSKVVYNLNEAQFINESMQIVDCKNFIDELKSIKQENESHGINNLVSTKGTSNSFLPSFKKIIYGMCENDHDLKSYEHKQFQCSFCKQESLGYYRCYSSNCTKISCLKCVDKAKQR